MLRSTGSGTSIQNVHELQNLQIDIDSNRAGKHVTGVNKSTSSTHDHTHTIPH